MIALILNEVIPQDIERLPERLARNGATVPALWHWEVANSLLTASRRSQKDWGEFRPQLEWLSDLDVMIDDDSTGAAWRLTATLAIRHGLTAYDAAYLELAIRRSLPLATLDKALAKAARAEGVEVIGG
jgi:predicted nucleic acid-binding protein